MSGWSSPQNTSNLQSVRPSNFNCENHNNVVVHILTYAFTLFITMYFNSRLNHSICVKWEVEYQLHPSSLQSGNINILQVPNLSFLCKIMSDLCQTFRIGPFSTTHIIFNVQLYTILQISSQEQSTSSKPQSHSFAELSLLSYVITYFVVPQTLMKNSITLILHENETSEPILLLYSCPQE